MKPGPEVLLSRRRCVAAALSAAAAVAWANRGLASTASGVPLEAPLRKYSRRAVALLERSLIIDMLGPLKLDMRPEAFSEPLTEAEVAMFRASGVTAFHNSVGVKMYDLTEALIRRGYSNDNIQAVLGGNFRRLLGESWQPQVEKKS